MSSPIYISRSFVEFGPFLPSEILDFHSRGILGELDHVRVDGHHEWVFISEWVKKGQKPAAKAPAKAKVEAPAPAPVVPPAPAAKKAAKKAAAKKAK